VLDQSFEAAVERVCFGGSAFVGFSVFVGRYSENPDKGQRFRFGDP
jgi:hypothetical protein